jgi:nucleotide-binding universal stress UspA family protein
MDKAAHAKVDIDRILCPIDFSETSRHALDHAATLARWYGAQLMLLYVHPTLAVAPTAPGLPLVPGPVLTGTDRDAADASLESFARDEIGSTIPLTRHVIEGHAAGEITAFARDSGTQLIVLGTHGRSGIERLLMGSVAERVLRTAGCPVLTVPPRVPERVPIPTSLFRRVLCAIDFSECSMKGLQYAMSIAQESGGSLTVLHVAELLPEDVPGFGEPDPGATEPHTFRDYLARAKAARAAQLEAAVPASVGEYCTVDTLMVSGKPYREILRMAAERSSDLVVLGVHGRSALDRFFFGSTTTHVVRAAPCPVLTVRQ